MVLVYFLQNRVRACTRDEPHVPSHLAVRHALCHREFGIALLQVILAIWKEKML